MPDFDKQALRKAMRSRIATMEEEVCQKSNQELFLKLLELPEYHAAETLFAYISVRREVDTSSILHHAMAHGKRIALPVVYDQPGQMAFAIVSSWEDLTEGRFGIPKPRRYCPLVVPDNRALILVPALCYDRAGFRLGQGGGYYDRWLVQVSSYTIGLCRETLLQEHLPHLSHDIGVDCVVTEKKILRLLKKPQ